MRHASAAPKSKAKPQPGIQKKGSGGNINREEMISVAAYYRAESRGFSGNDALADWLAAEAEIDAVLGNKNVH